MGLLHVRGAVALAAVALLMATTTTAEAAAARGELRVDAGDLGARATTRECSARLARQGEVVGEWFAPFPTCTYKGIPYALAPVGERRFAPPQPASRFANGGVFNATQYGPGCIQHCEFGHPDLTCPRTISEDCLSVNVFTPLTRSGAAASQRASSRMPNGEPGQASGGLPVLVFLHGGNYVAGAGGVNLYHGSRWACEQRAVIVTLNYRLGVLGGLYTKRGGIQGNFQLQDQRLALQWVQENAGAFGGDPGLVTIYGQSAGAFSVASHLASPKSWPFFQRAVAISDPIALPTETRAKSEKLSKLFVDATACAHVDVSHEEACLRALPAETILSVQQNTSFPTTPGMILHKFMPWTPVVDGDELPYSPVEAAKRGKLAPVPIMLGSVANESVQFIWRASPEPMTKTQYEVFIEAIFGPLDAHRVFALYGPPDAQMVRDGDVRKFLAQVGTDYIFTCSIHAFAKDAATTNPVFVYYYDHLPSYDHFMQDGQAPECENVICHGADLPMLFNTLYLSVEARHPMPTFAEDTLSAQMQTAWTNFARSGDPNLPRELPRQMGAERPVAFPGFNASALGMLAMGIPSEPRYRFRAQVCDVFDRIGYEIN